MVKKSKKKIKVFPMDFLIIKTGPGINKVLKEMSLKKVYR